MPEARAVPAAPRSRTPAVAWAVLLVAMGGVAGALRPFVLYFLPSLAQWEPSISEAFVRLYLEALVGSAAALGQQGALLASAIATRRRRPWAQAWLVASLALILVHVGTGRWFAGTLADEVARWQLVAAHPRVFAALDLVRDALPPFVAVSGIAAAFRGGWLRASTPRDWGRAAATLAVLELVRILATP